MSENTTNELAPLEKLTSEQQKLLWQALELVKADIRASLTAYCVKIIGVLAVVFTAAGIASYWTLYAGIKQGAVAFYSEDKTLAKDIREEVIKKQPDVNSELLQLREYIAREKDKLKDERRNLTAMQQMMERDFNRISELVSGLESAARK